MLNPAGHAARALTRDVSDGPDIECSRSCFCSLRSDRRTGYTAGMGYSGRRPADRASAPGEDQDRP